MVEGADAKHGTEVQIVQRSQETSQFPMSYSYHSIECYFHVCSLLSINSSRQTFPHATFQDSQMSLPSLNLSLQVIPISIHDLGPRRRKVLDELVLPVSTAVHL
jgi:hypothetical protein